MNVLVIKHDRNTPNNSYIIESKNAVVCNKITIGIHVQNERKQRKLKLYFLYNLDIERNSSNTLASLKQVGVFNKVKEGNDQEKAQLERNCHSYHRFKLSHFKDRLLSIFHA